MTTEDNNESKRPTHILSQVFDAEGEGKTRWMRIGAGWLHGDGKGMNLVLDALPLGGRLVLREWTPREEAGDTAPEGENAAGTPRKGNGSKK